MTSPCVLAFGDSLTAGYGLRADRSFAAQLQAALRRTRPLAEVVNAGVSGDTTAAGLARLPRTLSGLRVRPDLAIVQFGANDFIRGVDPDRTFANLAEMLGALGDAGIPALLAGMRAPPFLGPFARRFDAVFPRLADEAGVGFYPFFLEGVIGDASLVIADGVHPNARAIGMVVERMLPLVAGTLDRPASRAA